MFTSQVAIAQLFRGYTVNYSSTLTASVIALLPLLVLFLVGGKQLVA